MNSGQPLDFRADFSRNGKTTIFITFLKLSLDHLERVKALCGL